MSKPAARRLLRIARQLLADGQVDEKVLHGTAMALHSLKSELWKVIKASEHLDDASLIATLSELDKMLAGFEAEGYRGILRSYVQQSTRLRKLKSEGIQNPTMMGYPGPGMRGLNLASRKGKK